MVTYQPNWIAGSGECHGICFASQLDRAWLRWASTIVWWFKPDDKKDRFISRRNQPESNQPCFATLRFGNIPYVYIMNIIYIYTHDTHTHIYIYLQESERERTRERETHTHIYISFVYIHIFQWFRPQVAWWSPLWAATLGSSQSERAFGSRWPGRTIFSPNEMGL